MGINPADLAVLPFLVDEGTYRRGSAYARTGMVRSARWLAGGAQLYGEVEGHSGTPYTTWVRLSRDGAGRLRSFQGSCTCPVGNDCKHSIALLLAAPDPNEPPESASAARSQPWERALRGLVSTGRDAQPETAVGLQFEVSDASRSYRTGLSTPARIGIRPVTRGRSGAWIKSEIGWHNLTSAWGPWRSASPEAIDLLREIAAMDAASHPTYYGGVSQLIYLDTMPNKRIWTVLAEARALGMPFVPARGHTGRIRLADEPARLEIEATRSDGNLVLEPQLRVVGEERRLDDALLLGNPAHGLAWGTGAAGQASGRLDGDLFMAALAEPADAVVHAILEARRLIVPRGDEERFLVEYYPALRERVALVTSDKSVRLPQPEPPVLVLEVDRPDPRRLHLAWHWDYLLGEARRREPLWASGPARGRDLDVEAVAIKAVESALGAMADVPAYRLLAPTVGGEMRLAPTASLDGLDALRFLGDPLARLAEIDGVRVDVASALDVVREARSQPVVAVDATESEGNDWLDLSVTVTVDGEDVPFDELFVALARGESYLVLPSGTWFTLDRPELAGLAALIVEARAINDRGPVTARLSRYQVDLWEELERLGIIGEQAAAWQTAMRALSEADTIDDLDPPAGLTATLRPYQSAGFAWLAFLHRHGLGGILADEMGLGKTVQAIALFAHTRTLGEQRPFLVVAPTSVVYNWYAECERFAPGLDVRIVTETGRRRDAAISDVAAGADVVVTSYALFRLEYDQYAEVEWAGLLLDEAQFVKNAKSRSYRCAKLLPAPFKLAITGTPMENNLLELWALLSITAPGLFPQLKGFEEHFRRPIEKGGDHDRLALLRRRAKPLMLRRTKEQVVRELPPKQEQVVELPLNPRHRKVYDTHLHRERQKVLGLLGDLEHHRFEIFRSLTLLRQASLDVGLIDPRYSDIPSTKLDALMELLTEITNEGHRTLVFSQFTRFLGLARARLDEAGIEYCYLDGTTRRRATVLEKFRTGDAPVFLISLKAGGFGLNLTEADYCILLDPWWNPATEAQAIDRVHRIGQTRNVMVYRLVAKDTIEEKVMALKARKAALFGSVMSEGEFATGSLSAADIRGVLN
jgi:superfamily II DNA or RNA helicase